MVDVERRDAVAERAERVPETGRVGAARDEAADLAAGLDQVVLPDVVFDSCPQRLDVHEALSQDDPAAPEPRLRPAPDGTALLDLRLEHVHARLSLLALAVTHSAAKAGYVGAVIFLPLVAFNLVAGVAADRFERKRLMILSDVVGVATLAALGTLVLVHHATLAWILVAAFVDSTASIFYNAASRGAFRSVVPVSQLPLAASTVQSRSAIVRLSAPPVGGVLFGLARSLPFFADAVSYAFSTGSLLLMRTRFQEERERDMATLRQQFAEGIRYFLGIPFLRATIAMIAVSNFTVAASSSG